MKYVYYGNYAAYFEAARAEAFRDIGLSYKELEDMGLFMPVLSFEIKYFKPAFYDEVLTIKTFINELPKTRLKFDYETYNGKDEFLNVGSTVHAFVSAETMRPCAAPDWFVESVKTKFKI